MYQNKMKPVYISLFSLLLLVACSSPNNTSKFLEEVEKATIAPVETNLEEGRNGSACTVYIDVAGNQVIDECFSSADYFHEGLARVCPKLNSSEDKKLYGYINVKGEYVIPAKYQTASDFSYGRAWVALPDSCLMLIDTKGETIKTFPDAYEAHVSVSGEGISFYRTIADEVILINSNGDKLKFGDNRNITFCTIQYPYVRVLYTDEANNDTVKIYHIKDNELLLCPVSEKFKVTAWSSLTKLAVIQEGDRFGVADESGNIVINPHYEGLEPDNKWFLYLNRSGKLGWINEKDEEVIPAQYATVSHFDGSDYTVVYSEDGICQIIDRKGKVIADNEFKKAGRINNDIFLILTDEGYGFFDAKKNKIICRPQFTHLQIASENIILASSGGDYGVVNFDGKYLSPLKYLLVSKENFSAVTATTKYVNPSGYASFIDFLVRHSQPQIGMKIGELINDYGNGESIIKEACPFGGETFTPLKDFKPTPESNFYIGVTTDMPITYYSRGYQLNINYDVKAVEFSILAYPPQNMITQIAQICIDTYGWKLQENSSLSKIDESKFFYVTVSKDSITLHPGEEINEEDY